MRLANLCEFALSSCVHAGSTARAEAILRRVRAGMGTYGGTLFTTLLTPHRLPTLFARWVHYSSAPHCTATDCSSLFDGTLSTALTVCSLFIDFSTL